MTIWKQQQNTLLDSYDFPLVSKKSFTLFKIIKRRANLYHNEHYISLNSSRPSATRFYMY